MADGGGTQQSIRKALGALKDSTTVGLAKVNSDYKELDVAIVKATNHVEHLAKEKHMRAIFDAVSASRPRADVVYCINALARRLAKTHNWAVALKTLIVIHRALREVDPSFREELVKFMRTRGHMLNLSHFKDDSSPSAWDYSAWVRAYALYLEERLECFRVLKYDVETAGSRTSELDTVDLLEDLSLLQQLLYRLVTCQPEGAAVYNSVIRYALSIVAGESIKIYSAINGGTLNLVDKFFEMQRHDAVRALEIYRRAGSQAERLSEFYEICKGLDSARGHKFPKIEQPPASFIAAMEEYVRDSPRALSLNQNVVNNGRSVASKPVLAIEQKIVADSQEKPESAPTRTPATSEGAELTAAEIAQAPKQVQTQVVDLLSLDDFNQSVTELEDKNSFAFAIVPNDNPSNNTSTPDPSSASTGWELALISASSSNESAVAGSNLAGGLDKLTLDSLYDDAIARRTNQNGSYHMGQVAPNPFEAVPSSQDPFYASNSIAAPTGVQMATMAQQHAIMMQGQQQAMGIDASNPFGNPFGTTGVGTHPSHNPFTGFM